MAIGYLSPDTVSLRVSQARQLVPSGGRAEAKGPQSQHIIIAVILTKLFSGCETPVFHRCSGEIRQDMKEPEDKNASLAEVEDHLILLPTTAWNEDDDTFQGNWYCCGKSCYHFSKEEKTWERSMVSCQDLQSSLLKIDTKEEQVLIQSKIKYNHWIGLIRVQEGRYPWQWLDGSPLSQKLNFLQSLSDVKCGHLRPSAIYSADCSKSFRYICEKEFSGPDKEVL
ncbi:killer cell lectin-like receptor subfamily F member 2 isoform X2 [Panthera pardus]|uniref:Killer cell lectin-like receptor subfamily F member 2 isoform X2 n=1 Tax=Panthera pardus TaxID=9691 RepID=A0A9W2VDK7_PANPR|nr:killer cell lectin-like receptor subfamily F member 2 isoform X2 [Panthera pardus]XP_053765506.1 killer cell lectin-like receptor subfamily F member 2 isoform X2 [Panthera pardus]